MASRSVTVYADMMSQPSRAVVWFCRLANIPHKVELLQISRQQHKSAEYMKIHPFGKLPAIREPGFTLFESQAIVRYLLAVHASPASAAQWYPAEPQLRARVDCYLDWHHTGTRSPCSEASFKLAIGPRMGLPLPSGSSTARLHENLKACFTAFETVWLASSKFLAGDAPTIADLFATCEIAQVLLMKVDFAGYPRLAGWLGAMQALPGYAETHTVLGKVLAKM